MLANLHRNNDVFAAQDVRIVLVEEDDLWIIQAPPELIGLSDHVAKSVQEWDKVRMIASDVSPTLFRQLDDFPQRTGEAPTGHFSNLAERGRGVNSGRRGSRERHR